MDVKEKRPAGNGSNQKQKFGVAANDILAQTRARLKQIVSSGAVTVCAEVDLRVSVDDWDAAHRIRQALNDEYSADVTVKLIVNSASAFYAREVASMIPAEVPVQIVSTTGTEAAVAFRAAFTEERP
jgi:hypothetical protein